MTGTKTQSVGFNSQGEAVSAIHRAEKTDFLLGPAKLMAPLFTKTNTPTGAVVESRIPFITRTEIRGNRDGTVTERSTNINPVVHAGHYALTDVFAGVKKSGR